MSAPLRLRALRKRKGLTLEALAAQAGIGKGHLSRIERGEKTPSLGTLMALAAALGADMAELFGEQITARDLTISRHEDRAAFAGDPSYGIESILAASAQRPLAIYVVQPGPAFLAHDLPDHQGYEALLVLDGRIELEAGRRRLTLGTGDCAAYDAGIAHRLRSAGGPARVLVMIARDD